MAKHAGAHLHEYITKQKEYKEGNVVDAMKRGFLELDKEMRVDSQLKNVQGGTTVISLLIKDNVAYSVRITFATAIETKKIVFYTRQNSMK